MAMTKWRNTQLYSHEFVNCAGCVLFSHQPGRPVQVCFLHQRTKNEWLLPKGRQDRGESLQQAALRETYEETGYSCVPLPVDMQTRAPEPGVNVKDRPQFAKGCTEPFTVSLRHVSERDIKFVWWFVAIIPPHDTEKKPGTQMLSENFESTLWDVDVNVEDEKELNKAVERLTFANDREIVKNAIRLVYNTYPEWFTKVRRTS